jgi:hypothetical protein
MPATDEHRWTQIKKDWLIGVHQSSSVAQDCLNSPAGDFLIRQRDQLFATPAHLAGNIAQAPTAAQIQLHESDLRTSFS